MNHLSRCPIHGGNKWCECFLNTYKDNDRPRNDNNNGNNNSQVQGNSSRRGDSYHFNNKNNNGSYGGSKENGSNTISNNSNDRDRLSGIKNNDDNRSNNNDHFLADIGIPDWKQEWQAKPLEYIGKDNNICYENFTCENFYVNEMSCDVNNHESE